MHEINTELAVKYLVEELNLKNEAELAEKLQMTKNALSMLKKRNSLGTLIEKVLTNIDANVSMDRLVYGYSSNCFRAQTLAIENQKEDELATILENFIDSQTIMIKLKTKIQRIKMTADKITPLSRNFIIISQWLTFKSYVVRKIY